jgi:hypothetical protein
MNEYQRQAYLSGLGLDNYMPRWLLPLAPEPVACVLPSYSVTAFAMQDSLPVAANSFIRKTTNESSRITEPSLVADVIRDLADVKKTVTPPIVVADAKEREAVAPFTLSIWRPLTDLLVVDSRNARLALPTELLLSNILRAVRGTDVSPGSEELFQWPFMGNAAVAHTKDDVQSALQVWLEVELERRPVKYLWAFGMDALQYFSPKDISPEDDLWQCRILPASSTQAVLLPSLAELLQQPELKRDLWQCLIGLK